MVTAMDGTVLLSYCPGHQGLSFPVMAATAFVCVLVPYYWMTYTPWNFLFFCDVALLMTLAALWLESPLLASISAVGIMLPQFLWVFDLLTAGRVIGMASYMFDSKLALFVRV